MRFQRLYLAGSLQVAAALAAQGTSEVPDPSTLIARAEALLNNKESEFAVLALLKALEQLGPMPSDPANDAARQSALRLLTTADPIHERRSTAFAAIAKQEAELAGLYRAKKWLDVAATRSSVAAAFDRDVAFGEKGGAVGPKPKAATPGKSTATKAGLAPLLRRANAEFVYGEWKETDDRLQCQAPAGGVMEWVCKDQHADHEIVIEFQAADAAQDHHFMLLWGLSRDKDANKYFGYSLLLHFEAKTRSYGMWMRKRDATDSDLANQSVKSTPMPDGFHRLVLQVRGNFVSARLDATKPLEAETPTPARGRPGLFQGVKGLGFSAVQFRNLRINSLPVLAPVGEELAAKGSAPTGTEIGDTITSAKDAIDKKQPEAAARRLYGAQQRLLAMEPSGDREQLAKTIDQLLARCDPLASRRKTAGEAVAAELLALAGAYRTAGMARVAEVLTERASRFAPESGKPQ